MASCVLRNQCRHIWLCLSLVCGGRLLETRRRTLLSNLGHFPRSTSCWQNKCVYVCVCAPVCSVYFAGVDCLYSYRLVELFAPALVVVYIYLNMQADTVRITCWEIHVNVECVHYLFLMPWPDICLHPVTPCKCLWMQIGLE